MDPPGAPAITIVPYNPAWPNEFELMRVRLQQAFGSLARRIDHIGSTSVVGLDAKDIVDIQVGVEDFARVRSRVVDIDAAGFAHRAEVVRDHAPPLDSQPDKQWSKMFFRAKPPLRPANVHVRIIGHANHRYAILFRDYLRQHPPAAAAYGSLKHALALHCSQDRDAYVLVKDPACDIVMAAAQEWAGRMGWEPS